MRKLTKKALSLLLCVMLIASAISCALSVSADTVNPQPLNLDFSDGLNHWVSENLDYYTAENGVLKTSEAYESGSWKWLTTEKFNIPNAVEGTSVELSFDVEFEDGLTSMIGNSNYEGTLASTYGYKILDVHFYQYDSAGAQKKDIRMEVFYKNEGTIVLGPIFITSPSESFAFSISCGNSAKKTWEVSNINVNVEYPEGVNPGEEETEEPTYDDIGAASYYGTADKGFSSTLTSWPCRLKPADSLANLDFEAGFVYWSGELYQTASNTNLLPSDSFKIVAKDGNNYLTLKNIGYVDFIQSALFKVANASVGDTVAIVYDAKGADATTLRPYLKQEGLRPVEYGEDGLNTSLNPNGNGAIWNPSAGNISTLIKVGSAPTEFITQTEAEGWTTYITSTATLKDPTTITSSASSDIFLQILIGAPSTVNVGTKLDAAIDNIRIAKVVDGVYTDLATGEVIYDVNDAPEQEGTPTYYGTEKDGFSSDGASWPQPLKPADDIYNLNFEDGFVYWSGRNTGAGGNATRASDSFKLVDEGTNKYITIKDEGYVDTMRSALFNASEYVSVGDELVVMYSAKGADAQKLRVTLYQDHLRGSDYVSYDPVTGKNTTSTSPSPGMVNILVNNETQRTVYTGVTAPQGWTTYVTHLSSAVNDPLTASSTKICTEDIYLQVVIDAGKSVKAGHKLDAAIDNIVIAKVANGFYRDILTGEIIGAVVEHPEQENADTLAWLVGLVIAGQSEEGADFNNDGKVDLLDVVVLKKKLADIL